MGGVLLLAERDRYSHGLAADPSPARKSQEAIRAARAAVGAALPFALRAIHSDNSSEFVNDHSHGQARGTQFTRGRPCQKDHNAHIEQKNGTPGRRSLGWVRYDSEAAREALHDLYGEELRLFQNLL